MVTSALGKTSSTTYSYVYNGGILVKMTVGSNTLHFANEASGRPLAVIYNGTRYHYVTNLQGDVTGILDSNGNRIVTYTYDAWGNILSISGSHASTIGQYNPLRYRGYVYDSETQLYYLQSRYYDPAIGRFINADVLLSTGQGILGNNMFAYCNNNPVNYVDTNGQDPVTITITVTAVAVVAVIALGGLLIHVGAKALSKFLDWLSRQWYATFAKISFAKDETNQEKEKTEPEPPDVTYPGDDPEKAPEGYEWRGPDPQGGKRGGYANPKGKDSWHPDLKHPDGIPPHWDYNDGFNHKWRVFPDHIELVP